MSGRPNHVVLERSRSRRFFRARIFVLLLLRVEGRFGGWSSGLNWWPAAAFKTERAEVPLADRGTHTSCKQRKSHSAPTSMALRCRSGPYQTHPSDCSCQPLSPTTLLARLQQGRCYREPIYAGFDFFHRVADGICRANGSKVA
jgi:hypothetical protein